MSFLKTLPVIAAIAAGGAQVARAQWTYASATATGDCASLPANLSTGFTVEPVISRALFPETAPLRIGKLAFLMNAASGKTDIFMTEKGGGGTAGRVLFYNSSTNSLTAIGTIPNVYIGFQESGVWGIAINPSTFARDRFLYVLYATGSNANPSPTNGWRLSRYKVNATTMAMDLGSEKILLHVPAGTANRWHTAGSLHFDNFGNLYISLADNEALANGPANTADWRGGILRITPDTTDPKGYKVPPGNFGDYWAQQWQSQGLAARAAAYRDPAVVKPEIYIKGTRNPYSFSVDPHRLGWVQWSECGPDAQTAEEHNFTTKPAFSGWPFWAGNGVRQTIFASGYNELNEPVDTWPTFNSPSMTTAVPVNNWPNAAGYDTLPPMHAPLYATTSRSCAQGGPIIRYDGRIGNPGKMPPHLDNTVMFTDFNTSKVFAVKVNPATGAAIGSAAEVFTNAGAPFRTTTQPSIQNPIDFQQGPDGALYMVSWGAGCCNGDRPASAFEGIARIKYTGTCQDPALVPEPASTVIAAEMARRLLKVEEGILEVLDERGHAIRIFDAGGRTLFSSSSKGARRYSLPEVLRGQSGVYIAKVTTAEGTFSRSIPYFESP